MKNLEKFTIVVIILTAIITFILRLCELYFDIDLTIAWGVNSSLALLLTLVIYYLVKSKSWIYKIIFISFALSAYGFFAKINHPPFAGPAIILGQVAYFLSAIVFIRKSLQLANYQKTLKTSLLLLSAILIIQILTSSFRLFEVNNNLLSSIINNHHYIILAIILTLKLKRIDVGYGTGKVLNTLALLTIYPLIINVLRMINFFVE